jgi:hypothetical protein
MSDETGAGNGIAALERMLSSAVFHEPVDQDVALATSARAVHRRFVGELWERWGEDACQGHWRDVHRRAGSVEVCVVEALRSPGGAEAARAAPIAARTAGGSRGQS